MRALPPAKLAVPAGAIGPRLFLAGKVADMIALALASGPLPIDVMRCIGRRDNATDPTRFSNSFRSAT